MNRPLIIGQAPARGNDKKLPFAGQSGARLARLAGVGDSGDDLPAHFDLVNLNRRWPGKRIIGKGDKFNLAEARVRAQDILWDLQTWPGEGRIVLLMGRDVQKAMGFEDLNYLQQNKWQGHTIIVFPHPSGVNRWWNDPQHVNAARSVLMGALRASR